MIRQAVAAIAIACSVLATQAQPVGSSSPVKEIEKTARPYRILTTGKQVTIKSNKDIKSVMVWTARGHRILEDKNVKAPSYHFRISVDEKIFFVMLQMIDGKTFSEKIGLR